jgi:hypothetical protein
MLNDDQTPQQAPQHQAPRLIDFIGRDGTVPIKALLNAGLGSLLGGRIDLSGEGCVPRPANTDLAAALADVRVCHFRTDVRQPRPHARLKDKPGGRINPAAGYRLIQQIGLSSTRRIGVMLSNPIDTILSFGGSPADSARPAGESPVVSPRPVDVVGVSPTRDTMIDVDTVRQRGATANVPVAEPSDPTKPPTTRPTKPPTTRPTKPPTTRPTKPPTTRPTKTEPPAPIPGAECDILIHVERDAKGNVRLLRISGTTVRFHLSRRLVLPVTHAADQWAVGPNRVAVELGTSSIQLGRGFAPRVSTPLDCHGATVEIARRGMLAQLGTATLGGTSGRPQIIFDDIRLVEP